MNGMQLFGRLHPLVLHFPIALLLFALTAVFVGISAHLGALIVWDAEYFT